MKSAFFAAALLAATASLAFAAESASSPHANPPSPGYNNGYSTSSDGYAAPGSTTVQTTTRRGCLGAGIAESSSGDKSSESKMETDRTAANRGTANSAERPSC